MKIIFSPSKSQQTSRSLFSKTTPILFPKAKDLLIQKMLHFSYQEIMDIFNITKEKSIEVMEKTRMNNINIAAIELFFGTSFRELDISNYTAKQNAYMDKHTCILSALYGILEPRNAISPYKLDMNNNILKNTEHKNLYTFWEPEMANYFNNGDVIVNLASNEYSRMLKQVDTSKIITIHFLIEKDNKEKTIAVYAKQQRGKMLDYMITNMIHHPEKLQNYNNDGFMFNTSKSDELNYYFIKKID